MRNRAGSLCVVVLACGAGIAGIGCGNVASVPHQDAAQPIDTPLSSGGTVGTGGVHGSGGVTGTGGTGPVASGGVATGGITSMGTGGGGSPGGGGTAPTGGNSASGGSGGSLGGVLLIATYDGQVHATWQNQTSQSIFLYGCGTVEWSRLEGSAWVDHGAFVVCGWEGIAVEVAAGATYTETESFTQAEDGRYRLSGRYGVGCTPGLGLSNAGCTAFSTATSNEFVVPATGGSGGAGAGGVVGSGGASATGGSVGSGGLVGTGGATLQPVDASAATDGAGRSAPRDGSKVQTASLTAVQVFMQPSAPFLLQADLTRGAAGLLDVSAKVLVSVSGCTGDACNQHVTMYLSREETTQVESWLAVIPGEACHDDPGPICDFDVHYAVGIDGPPQNQTCCKLNEWGQNGDVTGLHRYLQNLAIAQLKPLDGSPG
jgi:hypothetical protein